MLISFINGDVRPAISISQRSSEAKIEASSRLPRGERSVPLTMLFFVQNCSRRRPSKPWISHAVWFLKALSLFPRDVSFICGSAELSHSAANFTCASHTHSLQLKSLFMTDGIEPMKVGHKPKCLK